MADPVIGEQEIASVAAVLRSGRLAAGSIVREFEDAFAAMVGTRFAVATSSGTAALQAAVRALDLEPGALVITTPFSFFASTAAIVDAGATPVFVDVDPGTLNIDPRNVAAALQKYRGVQAVLAVHLYGLPFDPSLLEVCDSHGLYLIEDAAQAHGAEAGARRAGALGSIACFSFYATKNMTTGEGGMVTTSDKRLAERVRLFINHGQRERYVHEWFGLNLRLTEFQAALGVQQLAALEARNDRRRETAGRYDQALPPELVRPCQPHGLRHVYHQYVVRTPRRDELARVMQEHGIDTAVHYPRLIPDQPAMMGVRSFSEPYPVAARATCEVLSLPVHPGISDEHAGRVISAAWAASGGSGCE